MNVITIFGTATQVGEVAEHRHRSRVTQASRFDDIDPQLPYRVPVNVEHYPTEEIGEAVYCELAGDGRLGVVAVVDAQLADRFTRPVYFSSEYEWNTRDARADGVAVTIPRIRLTGFAVTYAPAAWAARPLAWLPGDFRRDSSRWPIGEVGSRPLLQRALELKYELRSRPRLVDMRGLGITHPAERAQLLEDQHWQAKADLRPPGRVEWRPSVITSVS